MGFDDWLNDFAKSDLGKEIADFGRKVHDHASKNGEGDHTGNAQSRSWSLWFRSNGPLIAIGTTAGILVLAVILRLFRK